MMLADLSNGAENQQYSPPLFSFIFSFLINKK